MHGHSTVSDSPQLYRNGNNNVLWGFFIPLDIPAHDCAAPVGVVVVVMLGSVMMK